jgi:predicted AlkP superfamily pyrophosphatase or phosphodiesterase
MKHEISRRASALAACTLIATLGASLPARAVDNALQGARRVEHVLLISVDGLHEVDLERYIDRFPDSALATLVRQGVRYTHASTARPSDSFPGLMAFMTGGTPRSTGVFYDDSYDRTLFAPGSACKGAAGTETLYAENLDRDITALDGGGGASASAIDPAQLPLRLKDGRCEPVYPHQFIKVNTIMEVIHETGRRTAWSDKHPAYEILNGPSGKGLDELYAPEINSTSVPGHPGDDWTTQPSFARTYDGFKVEAVLNQIRGFDHTGVHHVGVPAMFGMNFQAVSVGQKVTAAGYVDASATPSADLAASLAFVDQSLGRMLQALSDQHLANRTLFIVGAKHGQSPIDVKQLHMIPSASHPNPKATLDVADPGDLLTNSGIALAQETADDVALLWLKNPGQAPAALALLEAEQHSLNRPRIAKIYAGSELAAAFGDPSNGRTPDLIVQPVPGTIYSSSATKIAEHGGFAADDRHVALIVSNPHLEPHVVDAPVTNMQVAPTILRALGIEPHRLSAVSLEGTHALPGLDLED